MKITFCLIFITKFRLLQHLQVIFSTEKQDFEKRTQMHENLECSAHAFVFFFQNPVFQYRKSPEDAVISETL